ncbi:MAG TPA: Na+/H+ antiporter [Dermatophilaceae bacterium]|nr:Na+/H+ antiporter [Dermatophilaceae bacterium]
MELAGSMLALVATIVAVTGVARKLRWSEPLLLVLVGVGASYLPFVPRVQLSAEVVLVGLLPPLLYAAAIRSSLIDFKANLRAIVMLSIGLVAFTAFGVALVTWWLLPVPFAVAFALGSVVAPPDAVAATAVARRIGLPRRLVTVLEGESLLNDATALVCLSTALAAIAGSVSAASVSLSFVRSAVGGLLVGVAVAAAIGFVRKHVQDSVVDTALSFMAPFLAYLPAERIHGSGVVAVVVAGLLLGHRSPVLQSASSRLSERINWSTIEYLLESSVFLVIGLQVRWVLDDVAGSELGAGRIALFCVAVLLAVVLLRPLWVFPARYLVIRPAADRQGRVPAWTATAVVSWAGMRGVVTLAAVLAIPPRTAHREVLVLAAIVVVGGTLLVQGLSLPWLARRLDVRGPDPREDALQEANLIQVAVRAGLADLDEQIAAGGVDDDVVATLRQRADQRANTAWERLGGSGDETPGEEYRRLRTSMLRAERSAILRIRDAGDADHDVLSNVLAALDIEESILERAGDRAEADREADLLPAAAMAAACSHLEAAPPFVRPLTPQGCPDCVREGTRTVHLRLCLSCGNVGCCDSSVGRHADRHHADTGHPVMRSFEPGEAWRWCYVDELLG